MSLREWSDRKSEKRGWLIRLEFGLVATLMFGSLVIAVASLVWAAAASAIPEVSRPTDVTMIARTVVVIATAFRPDQHGSVR